MFLKELQSVQLQSMLDQDYPEGWQPVGRITVGQRKSVGRKEQQRGPVMGVGYFVIVSHHPTLS